MCYVHEYLDGRDNALTYVVVREKSGTETNVVVRRIVGVKLGCALIGVKR